MSSSSSSTSTAPVVVIGGGIIGLCSALQIARTGLPVTLIDPGDPERAASFGNAGQLAVGEVVPVSGPGVALSVPKWLADPLGPLAIRWRYLPKLAPWLWQFLRAGRIDRVRAIVKAMTLMSDSALLDYQGLLAEAEASGVVNYSTHLRVYGARAEWEAETWQWEARKSTGQRFEALDRPALHAVEPALSELCGFALAFPDRAFVVEPLQLTQAFYKRFKAIGGRIVAGMATGFVRDGDRVTAVEVADGPPIAASQVVLAAGAWSGRLAALLGDRIPLETERGYHVMLPDPGVEVRHSLTHVPRGFAITPMAPGLRLAGTVEFAGLAAAPNWDRAKKLIEVAKTLLPGLRTADARFWMGHRPATPDSLPVIDRASQVKNVVYAFGHGHLGLSWGATTGRMVASLVRDVPGNTDLTPFGLVRFAR